MRVEDRSESSYETCDDCRQPYADVYRLDDELWELIHERAPAGLLCPSCAVRRALAVRSASLVDLPDDRRDKKPWLPQNDGRDVSDGLVFMDDFTAGRYPACWRHGAVARVMAERRVYRCQEMRCGVGGEIV